MRESGFRMMTEGEGSGVRDGEILPSKLCTIDLQTPLPDQGVALLGTY